MGRTRTDTDTVLEFREQQRVRRLMPRARLAAELAAERGYDQRTFFGFSLARSTDRPEVRRVKESHRFPDEVAALRAYVRAAVALRSGGSPLAGMADHHVRRSAGGRSGRVAVGVIKARAAGRRTSVAPPNERFREDFVDVGVCIDEVEWDRIELLILHDVLGVRNGKLAEELGTCPQGLGGHISQARRALRKALGDLIPSREKLVECAERGRLDRLAVRRAKIDRLLYKRLVGDPSGEAAS